jgi:hypothetical protein
VGQHFSFDGILIDRYAVVAMQNHDHSATIILSAVDGLRQVQRKSVGCAQEHDRARD